ncbi:MAG: hypothetical protein A2135_03785 [Actinobacteria bacterium RBG_16_67_15]|nr:MAG: hypothetical protein A2135_03785 [Actinobacteria bacterium RBG_16_67_15]
MIRTQISLEPEQMERARREAERRGISIAALIREALDRVLGDQAARERVARALAAPGRFHSGTGDTSDRHDDVLGSLWSE